MPYRLERNVSSAGVGLLTVFMTLVAILFYRQESNITETREWITHTYEVTGHIQQFMGSLKDLESGQRGYIITGTPSFLEPYQGALGQNGHSDHSLSKELTAVELLTADNPVQQQRIRQIKELLQAKLEFTAETIRVRDTQGIEPAMDMVRSEQGKKLTRDIQLVVDEMTATEESLLSNRIAQYEASTHARRLIMIIALLSCYGGMALAILMVSRHWGTRRRAEAALRAHHQLLQDILDASWNGIITTNPDGVITQFNKGAERMLGYKAEEVIGKHSLLRFHYHAEVREYSKSHAPADADYCPIGFYALVAGLDAQSAPRTYEWNYHGRNGTAFPVSVTFSAVRDEEGNVTGYLATVQDIAQQKEMERMKNEFISTVSHELRTPLTSIRGSLGLVVGGMAGALPEKASELLNIAHKNSERLIRLINDILDIEKIEAGKMRFDMACHDLSTQVRHVAETMEGYAERFGVRLNLTLDQTEGSIRVDSDRFQQVLSNLISNAVKFSPPDSEVQIETQVFAEQVRISVTDQGPGIDPAFQDQVFQKFAQADSSDSRAKGGTGLGLSISKAIAEKMDGNLTFETSKGEGTTFHFTLPRMSEPKHQPSMASELDSIRVLVCEDDPDVATLLSMLIQHEGYQVESCRTREEAKRRLLTGNYAAITLDLMLPDGSGVELIRELRDNSATKNLPIVVVSARAEEGKQELNGGAHGIIDWLVKPIDTERLMNAIHRAIHWKQDGKPLILHVEDDRDIVQVLQSGLEHVADLIPAYSIREAEEKIREHHFQLIILDISLPDGSGLEFLSRLNHLTLTPVPVLILSASDLSEGAHQEVVASLVKSRVSEDYILHVIRNFINPLKEPSA